MLEDSTPSTTEGQWLVRLRPWGWTLPGADVSREAAEEEYRICRTRLELQFNTEINDWWNEMMRRPRHSVAEEHFAVTSFVTAIDVYLRGEAENYTARLINRGTTGAQGVGELRSHVRELVAETRDYRWKHELSRLEFSDETIAGYQDWDGMAPRLTTDLEEILWKAEVDFEAAVSLWKDLYSGSLFRGPAAVFAPVPSEPRTSQETADLSPAARAKGGRPVSMVDGDKIRQLRGEWTEGTFARMCGLSVSTIQRVETKGHASESSLKKIVKILRRKHPQITASCLKKTGRNNPQ